MESFSQQFHCQSFPRLNFKSQIKPLEVKSTKSFISQIVRFLSTRPTRLCVFGQGKINAYSCTRDQHHESRNMKQIQSTFQSFYFQILSSKFLNDPWVLLSVHCIDERYTVKYSSILLNVIMYKKKVIKVKSFNLY